MTESITLRIPRELRSPNAWLWGHWRKKQRERADWETELMVACVKRSWNHDFSPRLVPFRRRVTVTRIVPSRRNFIKDDDNLRFAVKPLNDALKRKGLIYEDSRNYLEQPMPTQEVGPGYETVIVIEAIP